MSFFFLLFYTSLFAQQAYFADGYHGGIYGHYPVEWKTRFIVDKFNEFPEWKINLEIEPETWDVVKQKTPKDYIEFKKIVTDKRIEFTNPSYAQPYLYNISGESIIRQFEYGIKKTKEHFPEIKFITYSVEEPCFTSSLPQILDLFGFKYAVLKCPNTCWGGYTQAYGGELVNWIGPDGTSILSVPRYAVEQLEDNSTWQTKAWANSNEYLNACFSYGIKSPVGMCFQDAGWKNGPWLGHGKNVKNGSIYMTWKEYIEDISIGKTKDNWAFSQEDLLVNLMWGSQVLQKIGQEVRVAENNIVKAEKMATMSYLNNSHPYKNKDIDEAWRTLMLAQHHDSWIVPYNKLNEKRNWAEEISVWTANTNTLSKNIIENAVLSFTGKSISDGNLGYIRLYNTLGTSRSEIVNLNLPINYNNLDFRILDTSNKEIQYVVEKGMNNNIVISFKANVPPFGYATYKIEQGVAKVKRDYPIKYTENNECVIENDMYRIIFDLSKGGTIKSLIAKQENNKEYVLTGNEYLFGELSGYFYDDEKYYSSKDNTVSIKILKDNELVKSILIEGEIASHPFRQTVSIAQGQKRIDFDLKIEWKHNVGVGEYKQGNNWRDNRRAFCDDRFKLNILFPVDLHQPKIYKNAPFDVCESKLDNTFFNSWDGIKHNIILNWLDLAEESGKYGLALFSDHTTSYSYGKDFPLGLTVLYSGIGLWGWNYKVTGPSQIKYALLPHQNKWDKASISNESSSWNEPLVCTYTENVDFLNKSWIDVNNTEYEITSIQIKDDKILLRLFNADGENNEQKININFPISKITEVDLNGNHLKTIGYTKTDSGSEFSTSMPRFGLKTFLINKHF